MLIDFTRPEGTLAHVRACVRREARDGHRHHRLQPRSSSTSIRAAAATIPIVMAPNMSVGVNVALKLVELAARALGPDYDVEVFEMHHSKKVDAPSGTALKLGEVAAAARGATLERDGVFARHGADRRAQGRHASASRWRAAATSWATTPCTSPAPASASRSRTAPSSRANYAQGAMRAARFVAAKNNGLYDMHDVLGLGE